MNSAISLGRFRTEIAPYNNFLLTYEDPLTPTSFSILFDHIAVCLSASPYIALKNSDANFCLSHVETIKKYGSSGDEKGFILLCNDYSASDKPTPVKFSLRCSKKLHK